MPCQATANLAVDIVVLKLGSARVDGIMRIFCFFAEVTVSTLSPCGGIDRFAQAKKALQIILFLSPTKTKISFHDSARNLQVNIMKEIFIPTAKKYDGALSFSPQTKRVCAGTDVQYRWRVFQSNLTAGDFSRAVMLLDAKYYAMVYINGHVAAQYITRGYDFDKHYDVLDITPFLRNGTNSFAILTHGFRGESPHDFALEVRLFGADGERVASFDAWKFTDYPALSDRSNFFITSFGDEEIFDARIADEHIFDENYDFSAWQEATLIEATTLSFRAS